MIIEYSRCLYMTTDSDRITRYMILLHDHLVQILSSDVSFHIPLAPSGVMLLPVCNHVIEFYTPYLTTEEGEGQKPKVSVSTV